MIYLNSRKAVTRVGPAVSFLPLCTCNKMTGPSLKRHVSESTLLNVFVFSLSVCVVLAITSSQAIAGESPAIRLLSIPRVTTPPQIDGEAGDKEWATAAATTGFMKQPDLIASTGQPLVQVAYDDDAVYVAFVSSRWVKNHTIETLRDGGSELQILRDENRVDVFLQPDPPSGPWPLRHHSSPVSGGHRVL